MAKQHEVPDREPIGSELWWYGSDNALPQSTKPVTPTRAARGGKAPVPKKPVKQTNPGWTITIMVLVLVLIIATSFVIYLDIRRAQSEGRPSDRTTVAAERPSGRVLNAPPSPDTIKRRLQKAGFEVDYLDTVADQRNLAYDVAETHIDGHPALILVFMDRARTLKWAKQSSRPVVYKGTWAVSVPDQNLAGRLALKLGADLRG